MSDFGYVNARLRSMRSHLLTQQQVENLLTFDRIDSVADWMGSGPYAAAYGKVADRESGLKAVDHAISERLRETLARCVNMVSAERNSPLAMYLARVDFENVKVVVRAILNGEGFEGAEPALVPMPSLDRGALERLCEQQDLEAVAGMLMTMGHPAGPPLRRFLRLFTADEWHPNLATMDRHLERAYYANALAALEEDESEEAEPLRTALQDEVDLSNLRTALKLAFAGGGDLPNELIPFGRLKANFLSKVAECRDLPSTLEWVGKTIFRKAVDSDLEARARSNDLGGFERLLEKVRLTRLARGAIEDPTGLGFTLRFLGEVFLEAQNLRLAARAVAGLIPTETVQEAMIHV